MSAKDAVTVPESPHEAFELVCKAFVSEKGTKGIPAMAVAMGMKGPGVLYNKCNADDGSHHQPTLRDVVLVSRISGDLRILDSLNRMFMRGSYDLTGGQPVSDEALLELMCKLHGDNGDLHKAVLAALCDGHFSIEDLKRVRAEAYDLINSVLTFVQRLEGLVDD